MQIDICAGCLTPTNGAIGGLGYITLPTRYPEGRIEVGYHRVCMPKDFSRKLAEIHRPKEPQ